MTPDPADASQRPDPAVPAHERASVSQPPPADPEPVDVLIVGGGMAGLAAGIRCAMFDKRVRIVEKHGKLGGLNSYYKHAGIEMDVGLHAVTNYAPPGMRRRPLNRLLRQLRIPHEALSLSEQVASEIRFPSAKIRIEANGADAFRAALVEAFPRDVPAIDGLFGLVDRTRAGSLDTTPKPFRSARRALADVGLPGLLVEMLMCPIQYYGSAWEHDIDLDQFTIMFDALFTEGIARPREGVRRIIRLLEQTYLGHGGELELRCPVARLEVDQASGRVVGALTQDGRLHRAATVISTAGLVETDRLRTDRAADVGADKLGRLTFVETMAILDRPASELGIDVAICFFSTEDRFHYARPETAFDTRSGVICCPQNYRYDPHPAPNSDSEGERLGPDNLFRVTAQANYDHWRALSPDRTLQRKAYKKADGYKEAKAAARDAILATGQRVMGVDLRPHILDTDTFTPMTIESYTSHPTGAVYGTPDKARDGRTDLANLYIAGTDQGFLGITGAMLSGITIANQHVLTG